MKISPKRWGILFMGFTCLAMVFAPGAAAEGNTLPSPAAELHPREVASDLNGDGEPDRWETFDAQGILMRIEADTNGDGRIDETVFVEKGEIHRVEKDSDHDGKIDQWIKY